MPAADNPPPGGLRLAPYVVECAAGKHAWCRCQRSASYPLCDGSHRNLTTGGEASAASAVTPLKVEFDAPRRVAWCACGRTGKPPFCDGSHARAIASD
jgi:CDGSH-type Zn-finger protein